MCVFVIFPTKTFSHVLYLSLCVSHSSLSAPLSVSLSGSLSLSQSLTNKSSQPIRFISLSLSFNICLCISHSNLFSSQRIRCMRPCGSIGSLSLYSLSLSSLSLSLSLPLSMSLSFFPICLCISHSTLFRSQRIPCMRPCGSACPATPPPSPPSLSFSFSLF